MNTTSQTNFETLRHLRHLLDRLETAHQDLGAERERAHQAESEVARLHGAPHPRIADIVALVEAIALSGEGQKIEAIKLYRAVTGYGLKESKDAVERVTARFAVPAAA